MCLENLDEKALLGHPWHHHGIMLIDVIQVLDQSAAKA